MHTELILVRMSAELGANKARVLANLRSRSRIIPRSQRSGSITYVSSQRCRAFSIPTKPYRQECKNNQLQKTRLVKYFNLSKIKLLSVILGSGICIFGFVQAYRKDGMVAKAWNKYNFLSPSSSTDINEREISLKRRKKVRPNGPWQVQVMSTLPLKAISRIWGWFNELEIPYILRVPGFKLYSYIFGVNLSEVSEPDLHAYPNLASFFYRKLKPGLRPLDPNPDALLSPADGRVLQFGLIEDGEVEQVKGITYRLDALLGGTLKLDVKPELLEISDITSSDSDNSKALLPDSEACENVVSQYEEFGNVNGISYTLSTLLSGFKKQSTTNIKDASTTPKPASEAEVKLELSLKDRSQCSTAGLENKLQQKALYYIVVYLAPGDYHRFHSPCSWIVETRRHFAGELYSVSPYLQRLLPGLFTLNERVVLLGRWRWGFFSYIPVGATNVGSIKINFDRELKTNSLRTDTAADLAAEEAVKLGEKYCGYSEATYGGASSTLSGYSLRRGEEMGGFQLGSTIVMVFEATKGQRPSLDEGWMGENAKRIGGWKWVVERGQKVKMGEALGWIDEI